MKRVFWLVIVIVTCVTAYSQEPTERVKKHTNEDSFQMLRSNPHRVKITVEMRDTEESPWEEYSVQTREVNGYNWRSIQSTRLHIEVIRFGDNMYRKFPDRPWELFAVDQLPLSATAPSVIGTAKAEKPVTVASKNPEDMAVRETTSRTKLTLNGQDKPVELVVKRKEWFDELGRCSRVEAEYYNVERKKFQRVTEVYEYDPSIRIEAPIK